MDLRSSCLLLMFLLAYAGVCPAQNLTSAEHLQKGITHYKADDYDLAFAEAQFALQRGENAQQKAKAYYLMANTLVGKKVVEPTFDTLEVALALPLAEFPLDEARLHRIYGAYKLQNGSIAKAKEELAAAISLAEKHDFADSIHKAFNVMGVAHLLTGEYATSLTYFNRFLELLERKSDTTGIAFAHVNIGSIHEQLNDFAQAEKSYFQALDLWRQRDMPQDMAAVYSNLGSLMLNKGALDSARSYLDSALTLQVEGGFLPGQSITLGRMASEREQAGQARAALEILRRKIALDEDRKAMHWRPTNYWRLAHYLSLNGRSDSVEHYYTTSITLADSQNLPTVLQEAQFHYFTWLKEQSRFEEALAVHEDYLTLKLKLNDEASQKLLAQERSRFKVVEAQNELEDAIEENVDLEATNTLYVGLLVALALLFLLVLVLLWQIQKTRRKLEQQNIQLVELVETKNKFFSIIAHDIRSPLVAFQNIGKRIGTAHQKGNTEKVERLTTQLDESATQLNGLLNNLLSWALLQNGLIQHRPESIPVEDVVLDNLDLFQDLAQMKNISLETKLEAGLRVTADENALHLMVRNLLSNAIKFTPTGGKVEVTATRKAGEIVFQVSDTGPGIPKHRLQEIFSLSAGGERGTAGEKGVGLGLHLISELMRLHQGKVDASAEPGQGSIFTLAFPN